MASGRFMAVSAFGVGAAALACGLMWRSHLSTFPSAQSVARVRAGQDSPTHGPGARTPLARTDEPGGTPADAALAKSNPDEYAWQLFFFLNRQAETDVGFHAGKIDSSKADLNSYDDDKDVVWESWALANEIDHSDIFSCSPKQPVAWDQLTRPVHQNKDGTFSFNFTNSTNLSTAKLDALVGKTVQAQRDKVAGVRLPPNFEANVEVRFNESEYTTLRSGVWNQDGIIAAIASSNATPQYPNFVTFDQAGSTLPSAKAIKAKWVVIRAADKPRYHWRLDGKNADGSDKLLGLAAFHVMSHDLDNWFWADFIHVDCVAKQAPCNNPADFSSTDTMTPKDRTVTAAQPVRAELKAGGKWSYYRLMGTQNGFASAAGGGSALADPMLEKHAGSSCMTCHSYAAAMAKQRTLSDGSKVLTTPVTDGLNLMGTPSDILCSAAKPCGPGDKLMYFRSSFTWSLVLHARETIPECESTVGPAPAAQRSRLVHVTPRREWQ